MESRRSVGVTIGWIVILANIIFLLLFNYLFNSRLLDHLHNYFCPSFIMAMFIPNSSSAPPIIFCAITPLINICFAIGLMRLKNIFRILFILHQILNMGWVMLGWLMAVGFSGKAYIPLGAPLMYILLIVIFTRPQVKEQFK